MMKPLFPELSCEISGCDGSITKGRIRKPSALATVGTCGS
jgi:hypothetical protein